MRFYKCKNCDQVFIKIVDNEKFTACCNEVIEEIIPNSSDGLEAEHLPKIRKLGNFVSITIGEVPHPMIDIHNISFILMETNKGVQYKYLSQDDIPFAEFIIANKEEILNVYVYCTVHSLWKTNIN